jgi:hypothetical protein
MKKLLSLLLCLSLVLGCAVALAETATTETVEKSELVPINIHNAFVLRGLIPEGYKFTIIESDDTKLLADISAEDPARPVMQLSIYADEAYADVERFNDLPEEDVKYLEGTFSEDSQVEISYSETSLGTKLMVIREVGNDMDYVDFFSIYKGHMIELVLVPGRASDGALTQEQIDVCVKLLSELDFVPVEENAQ